MRFDDVIERDGKLIYTNVGDSMLPFIRQDRDLVIIEKPRGRLKKFDVAFYKRDNGGYILHRVVKVTGSGYVIRGDNRYEKEYGITDRHIIGVLTATVRGGKEIRVTSPFYRLSVRLWYASYPIRSFIRRVKSLLIRIFKKKAVLPGK